MPWVCCNVCGGKGLVKCPTCEGEGRQKVWREVNRDAWWWEDCEECGGKKEIRCPSHCQNGRVWLPGR